MDTNQCVAWGLLLFAALGIVSAVLSGMREGDE